MALINNVDDAEDAALRARSLIDAGEISDFAFVADHIQGAMTAAGLSERDLRTRPYLIDYGIVMPYLVHSDYLLGWDAETRLNETKDWITPAVRLLEDHPEVFNASLAWPRIALDDPGFPAEEVGTIGPWSLNWGFSDQLFLVRTQEMRERIYSRWSAAAYARHAPHPYTFEYRVESYQRCTHRCRATLSTLTYSTHVVEGGVLSHTGGQWTDFARIKALHKVENGLLNRLPPSVGPRWTKNGRL